MATTFQKVSFRGITRYSFLMEVSVRLVGSAAFKAVETSEPRLAGSIPVHLRQSWKLLLFAIVGLWLFSPAVSAHADPAQPGNTRSVVQEVTPTTAAIEVSIVGVDAFVKMKVQMGHSAEVIGYDEEPYLLIDEKGRVFENSWSPTVVINKTRYGSDSTVPAEYVSTDAPTWRQIASNGEAIWHDHRVHWMSPLKPAVINADGLVQDWLIDMKVDGVTTAVVGSLYVEDAPGSWWWLLVVPTAAIAMLLGNRLRKADLVVVGIAVTTLGVQQFFSLPSVARATPSLIALGVVGLLLALVAMALRGEEFVVAVSTAAGIALVVAVGLHRNQVTQRFVPGVGDAWYVRVILPVALGIGAVAIWHGLNELLRVPQPVVRESKET